MYISGMKQGIIGFLLAIVLIVGMSATTLPSLLTVKPATPKSVFTNTYDGANVLGSNFKQLKKDIQLYSSKGYIVKVCESQKYSWVLVMEKY